MDKNSEIYKRLELLAKDRGCSIDEITNSVKVMKAVTNRGVFVALKVPEMIGRALVPNSDVAPEDMHVTLVYLGRLDNIDPNMVRKAMSICQEVCERWGPLTGKIGGVGRFFASEFSDGEDVLWASYNCRDLVELRQEIIDLFRADGVPFKDNHGFTPHITLKYVDPAAFTQRDIDLTIIPREEYVTDVLSLYVGPDLYQIPFSMPETEDEVQPDQPTPISNPDAAALSMMGLAKIEKEGELGQDPVSVQITNTDPERRIIYGVVLEPYDVDLQDQVLSESDVEFAAHHFMAVRGIMAFRHRRTVPAVVLESYIAPCDFVMGNQKVRKGSWVLVSRCDDDATWQSIVSGELTGYSVGGFGVRRPLA